MGERYYNPNTRREEYRETKSKEDVASAQDKDRLTTVAGTGLGAKGKAGSTAMPKQEPGESPAAYAARLRMWRERDADARARAKALK